MSCLLLVDRRMSMTIT